MNLGVESSTELFQLSTSNFMNKNSTKVIMIGVFKGGVGKTTTAINLGHALALQKKNVLILDLDPQGNATRGLGYEVTELTPTVYTVMKGISRARRALDKSKKICFYCRRIEQPRCWKQSWRVKSDGKKP